MGDNKQLVLVRGLPGAGKSTFALEQFPPDKYPTHAILEPDKLFMDMCGRYLFEAQLWKDAMAFIANLADFQLFRGRSVVVPDVFPTLESITPFKGIARHHGADFIVFRLQNGLRKSVHDVPLVVIDRFMDEFDPCPGEIPVYDTTKEDA